MLGLKKKMGKNDRLETYKSNLNIYRKRNLFLYQFDWSAQSIPKGLYLDVLNLSDLNALILQNNHPLCLDLVYMYIFVH